MPTTVRHRVLSACAEDAIDDVRKMIAAANTFPRAFNRSMFFISRPPCVVRECFSRDQTLLVQSIERQRVQIIPLLSCLFATQASSVRNESVAHVPRAARSRTGKLLLGTYGDECLGRPKMWLDEIRAVAGSEHHHF